MVRLEKGAGLGRVIRRDDIGELALPTWTLIRESIRAGKVDEALALLDYCYSETKTLHDGLVSFVDYLLTRLGDFGEEEVYQALKEEIRSSCPPLVVRYTGSHGVPRAMH